jgi:hypothetical protein
MSRLRGILLGVLGAGAVGGAVVIYMGAGATAASGVACIDPTVFRRLEPEPLSRWFVAVAESHDPGSVGGMTINCAVEDCAQVPAQYCFTWTAGDPVAGSRLWAIEGNRAIGKLWRDYAEANPSTVKFARSYKDAAADLRTTFTAAQTRALLSSVAPCWMRADGQLCRYGRLYGPGLGGVNPDGSPATCTVQATDTLYPCDDIGRGPQYIETAGSEAWTDP